MIINVFANYSTDPDLAVELVGTEASESQAVVEGKYLIPDLDKLLTAS